MNQNNHFKITVQTGCGRRRACRCTDVARNVCTGYRVVAVFIRCRDGACTVSTNGRRVSVFDLST
jgi:hypothetical protein